MEQLLRGKEVSAVTTGTAEDRDCFSVIYDLSSPLLYIPVRHHSPVCAFHLKKAIADYEPDCILIEGPRNAQSLIPVLTHADTKPPLALYYSYRDKAGLVNPDKEDYKCYYPFLDCSPELAALREANARGIPAEFVDLPYSEILIGTVENRGIRREGEKQTYNDDYLLSRSKFLKKLCEKTGLRDFEEFWEKYFEIRGLYQDTKDFVQQMFVYCQLTRQNTPAAELEEDGCLLRERFMAQQIAEAAKQYKRILIVTGGFHTGGLMELLEKESTVGKETRVVFTGAPVKLHAAEKGTQEVYPMAYSMEAADALNGYASGMQSPGFYQKVWEGLEEKEKMSLTEHPGAGVSVAGAYENAVLSFLAAAGKKARQKDEGVSSYDEICAFSMAQGLASLRGKPEPGLYELRDSALSSFVKGEYSLSTDGPLRILQELVTGSQVGKLCADAMRPPLLSDFEEQCRRFGLKIHVTQEQELVLDIFGKDKHLRLSRFLYQTEFLNCGFAKRKKGSDLVKRQDRNRIREIWTYKWSGQVTAALVDASVSGGTLEEAVHTLWNQQFAKRTGCKEAAELLVRGFLMGLCLEQERVRKHLAQVLAADGDFFSLSRGFSQLLMLSELQELYKVRDSMNLEELISVAFQKIIQLLPSMGQVKEEQQTECMESLRTLYQATGKSAYIQLRPLVVEALERLLSRGPVQPGVEGSVLGLLYGYDSSNGARIAKAAEGYMQGTPQMMAKSAAFLRGLFFTARDFVFVSEAFLQLVDELLQRLPGEEFVRLLPELRLAFSYFTPIETNRIASRAAALHGEKKRAVLQGKMVNPQEYAYGEWLDRYASRCVKEELA